MEKNLKIFYHTYLINNFKELIQEQLTNVLVSGLYKACNSIYLGITSGDKHNINWVLDLVKHYPKIIPIIHSGNSDEKDTQRLILKNCNENDYICYFHTKGVTRQNLYTFTLWRRLMDYHNITQWKECVNVLDQGYDCVGPLYREDTYMGFFPHFSGGYWWATHNHIMSLDSSYINNDHHLGRMGAEFWIGSNYNSKNYSNFIFEEGIEPYGQEYLISRFIKNNI
jgi:hypothetical protein